MSTSEFAACRLADVARRFHAIYAQAMQQKDKDGEKSVRASGFLQRRLRGAGLRYFDNCELTMYTKRQRQLKDKDIVGVGEIQQTLRRSCMLLQLKAISCRSAITLLQGEPAQIHKPTHLDI